MMFVYESTPCNHIMIAVGLRNRRTLHLTPVANAPSRYSQSSSQIYYRAGFGDGWISALFAAVGNALQQLHLCFAKRLFGFDLADRLLDSIGAIDFQNGVGLRWCDDGRHTKNSHAERNVKMDFEKRAKIKT